LGTALSAGDCIGGFKVTLRHFFKRKVTMQYPEEKWVVPAGYRGAPYLVKDQDGNTKCVSCQLCEFVCPPKAIASRRPARRPSSPTARTRKRCRGIRDQHAPLHLLRLLPGSLPGGGDFPA
jgi:formate hydrogenlyase subunit 6/NADH:ubiquinone oxidoreductase subunit I